MTTYRLDLGTAAPASRPTLDDAQRAVVEHESGPLLVLAGPGSGKTTTMVEAVVDLVERRGVDPASILLLTFSRKAAEHLRDTVTARLGRTLGSPMAATFHSFAYGLVRRYSPQTRSAEPLRLLTAAEQDVVLRELLADAPEAVRWPESLRLARDTRGFAIQVQRLLSRARERGLDGAALRKIGWDEGLPEWVSAGDFLEQYLDVLDAASSIDYANLVYEAVNIATHADVQPQLHARYSHVFVDEFQDTDPAQVALLSAIAGGGRNLVVVGDPDQSIYGFRGAEVRGILDFPARFRRADGEPAPVIALATTRRFGPVLLEASRRVAGGLPHSGSIPPADWKAFRDPVSLADTPGEVAVRTFDTPRSEAEHIANALRRAHLNDRVRWQDMAVLVRTGAAIPHLRRALIAAGVPVEVAEDDTPLVREPAIEPLLETLRAVTDLGVDDPASPAYIDGDRAERLLMSPIGGLDAAEIRQLVRRVRSADRELSSSAALRLLVLDPSVMAADTTPEARKVTRFAGLLRAAAERLASGDSAEEVLWVLWSGTEWPERLRRTATSGGPGAVHAHRDLDAICALFETAARAEEKRGHTSVAVFVDTLIAQEIPADTLADRGVRGGAVRLMTAHRSKGLEWDVVVLAQVQEEVWPDLRRRTTLLRSDELSGDGRIPPTTVGELLAEERRLFYVGVTRARRRLLVTAVASQREDGERPSRFVSQLGVPVTHITGRLARPMSLTGVVSELRRVAADDEQPVGLRAAAVRRLARLATASEGGRPLAPAADPGTWWGARDRSYSDQPLRPVDEPIGFSATSLRKLSECSAAWFLEREAGGERVASTAQSFGNLVHAIAQGLATGEISADGDLLEHADRVWDQLSFRTPWSSAKERHDLEAVLRRLARWLAEPRDRRLLATETALAVEVALPGGEIVRLRGFADRLEIDSDGKVWAIDIKTTKKKPTVAEVTEDIQLGFYQYLIDHGAADDLLGAEAAGDMAVSGGAELWQLRDSRTEKPAVQQQPSRDDQPSPIEARLQTAVELIRSERLAASPGRHCDFCAFDKICPARGSESVLS